MHPDYPPVRRICSRFQAYRVSRAHHLDALVVVVVVVVGGGGGWRSIFITAASMDAPSK